MVTRLYRYGTQGLALVALLSISSLGWCQQAPPGPSGDKAAPADAITVEARGPVHEAYAQPLQQNPRPGPVVAKKPPPPIQEIPPDQKPEGNNVQWLPGYWAWDNDRNDFLWVSGFWRIPPPGRKWVPGHWTEVEGGSQWVPGFWAPDNQGEVPYLQQPPASLDAGPNVPQPDENSTYVPGCWVYRDTRFAWRPGYWIEAQAGYVWTPDHYCYTPAGNVFVNGYWDYTPENRGLLFAPCSFSRPLWEDPGWAFQPSYCVSPFNLLSGLFVRPYCNSYYFGDYCGQNYLGLGYQPWCLYGPRSYDPLFSYYNWQNQGNPDWYRGVRGDYLARLNGDLPRLPHTFGEQERLLRDPRFRERAADLRALRVVQPLSQVDHAHLRPLSREQGLAHQRETQRFREVSHQRQNLERAGQSLVGGRSGLSVAGVPAVAAREHGAARPAPQVHVAQPAFEHRGGHATIATSSENRFQPERGLPSHHAESFAPPARHSEYHPDHRFPGAYHPGYAGDVQHSQPLGGVPYRSQAPTPHYAAPTPHYAAPRGYSQPAPSFHSAGHPMPGNFHAQPAAHSSGSHGNAPSGHGGGGGRAGHHR